MAAAGDKLRAEIEEQAQEAGLQLDQREQTLLTEACKVADLLADLQEKIDEHGAVYLDRKTGEAKVQGIVVESRLARQTLQKLLGHLDLQGTGKPQTAASLHGKRISRKRYGQDRGASR